MPTIRRARRSFSKKRGVDNLKLKLWAMPVARAYNPDGRKSAEMIRGDLARIGVDATVVTFEWGDFLRRSISEDGDRAVTILGARPAEEIPPLEGDDRRIHPDPGEVAPDHLGALPAVGIVGAGNRHRPELQLQIIDPPLLREASSAPSGSWASSLALLS